MGDHTKGRRVTNHQGGAGFPSLSEELVKKDQSLGLATGSTFSKFHLFRALTGQF